MLVKSFTAGIVGSAILASTAFAQTPSTTTTTTPSTTAPSSTMTTTSTSANNSSYNGNWRTSKVVGLNVYNDAGESLGSINDLLTDTSGKIVAAVIGVGGFLGVGERYVAIPFEKVKFNTEPVKTSAASGAATGGGAAMGSRPATTTTTTTGAAGGGMATPAATPAASAPNPWYPDHAVISGTKDELKAMTEFKYTNS